MEKIRRQKSEEPFNIKNQKKNMNKWTDADIKQIEFIDGNNIQEKNKCRSFSDEGKKLHKDNIEKTSNDS